MFLAVRLARRLSPTGQLIVRLQGRDPRCSGSGQGTLVRDIVRKITECAVS